jgi:hypothetical protein
MACQKPIMISNNGDKIQFVLENRTGDNHVTQLKLHSKNK